MILAERFVTYNKLVDRLSCGSSKGLVDLYQSVIADPMNGGVSTHSGYVYVDRQTVAELLGLKAN